MFRCPSATVVEVNSPRGKFAMEAVLVGRGVWTIVSGDEKLAADAAEPIKHHFNRRKDIAYSVIISAVDECLYEFLSGDRDPARIWTLLGSRFKGGGFAALSYRLTAYFTAKLGADERIQDFLSRMSRLRKEITTVTFKLDDEVHIWRILDALPESYAPVLPAIRIAETVTIDRVNKVLLDREQDMLKESGIEGLHFANSRGMHRDRDRDRNKRRGARNNNHNDSNSNNSNNHNYNQQQQNNHNNKNRSSAYNPDHFCTHCQRQGHTLAVCRSVRRKPQLAAIVGASPPSNGTPSTTPRSTDHKYHGSLLMATPAADTTVEARTWYLDSGASSHMTGQQQWLHNYRDIPPMKIFFGNNAHVTAVGIGDVFATCDIDSKPSHVTFTDVLFVPQLVKNFISALRVVEKGFEMNLNAAGCTITKNDDPKLVAKHHGGMLVLRLDVLPNEEYYGQLGGLTAQNELELLHRRLGHISMDRLKLMVSHAADMRNAKLHGDLATCIACVKGKMHREGIGKGPIERASRPMELIHTDVCGPFSVESFGRKLYFVSYIDDFSRYAEVYFMRHKNEAFNAFKQFLTASPHQQSVRTLRSDNGGEYVNKDFSHFLQEKGITHLPVPPYTPQYNGVAERLNRTLLDIARALLAEAELPKRFWAEAIFHAAYLNNRAPTKANNNRSPFELWTGQRPNLSHLRIFGCKALMRKPEKKLHKLDERAVEVLYLGVGPSESQYRLWIPGARRMAVSRDVIFLETVDPDAERVTRALEYLLPPPEQSTPTVTLPAHHAPVDPDALPDPGLDMTTVEDDVEDAAPPPTPTAEAIATSTLHSIPAASLQEPEDSVAQPKRTARRKNRRRSRSAEQVISPNSADFGRGKRKPVPNKNIFNDKFNTTTKGHLGMLCAEELEISGHLGGLYIDMSEASTPTSYKQAIDNPVADKWKQAMNEEYTALLDNNTFELVPLPPGRQAVGTRWVYKVKRRANGSVERYKARWVAKGFFSTFRSRLR
jgi:transposase InsO family protein